MTGVQTCALPISTKSFASVSSRNFPSCFCMSWQRRQYDLKKGCTCCSNPTGSAATIGLRNSNDINTGKVLVVSRIRIALNQSSSQIWWGGIVPTYQTDSIAIAFLKLSRKQAGTNRASPHGALAHLGQRVAKVVRLRISVIPSDKIGRAHV